MLVTGGAGFIGSHLVDRLLADGHAVFVVDDCSTGSEHNLDHHAGDDHLRFVRGRVPDEELVTDISRDIETVYHLAAAVGVRYVVDDPLWTIETNTRGTENVLQQAVENGARVVFASTSEIYGASDAIPFAEDGQRVLGPTWIPRWSYSTSKALDEHLCFALAEHGLDVSIVRYFNIYGPRMDPAGYGSVIAKFLTQAVEGEPLTVHGDGEQTRCFTYVSEAVDATVRAATMPVALGEVFNIGSSDEISINELAETVLRVADAAGCYAVGGGAPIGDDRIRHVTYEEAYGARFHDTRRRVPDVTKASEVLGWRAEIGLDDGLARTLATWDAAP
ncbi:MAG: GDP-mannose 4,6-dehydratase [Anaerolineae bacterium]